ncbi:MAG TPA: hypothetical protein VJN18_01805 [Polyangiaceae bacterium]|nr:hypothetical protein [Polyangiaceae bacterium]
MTDQAEHLATDFAALLSLLDDILSPSQVWEIQVFLDYDEHEFAFSMLCSMLRTKGAPISEPGLELLGQVAKHLGVNEARWRGIGRARRQ